MTRDDFWALIDSSRSSDDLYEQTEVIQTVLSKRTVADIVAFQRHMTDLLTSSYTWKLWGAAYLINGGCSDDGFDYFRGWLILQGQSIFNQVLADPDFLADVPGLEEEVEFEEILYVAQSVHESITGNEFPDIPINNPELGEGWDFENDGEMKERYPKLFAKFCED
jgi:Protein of unknown function (DUF4240)